MSDEQKKTPDEHSVQPKRNLGLSFAELYDIIVEICDPFRDTGHFYKRNAGRYLKAGFYSLGTRIAHSTIVFALSTKGRDRKNDIFYYSWKEHLKISIIELQCLFGVEMFLNREKKSPLFR